MKFGGFVLKLNTHRLTDGVRCLRWRHTFKMAAMASCHAGKYWVDMQHLPTTYAAAHLPVPDPLSFVRVFKSIFLAYNRNTLSANTCIHNFTNHLSLFPLLCKYIKPTETNELTMLYHHDMLYTLYPAQMTRFSLKNLHLFKCCNAIS